MKTFCNRAPWRFSGFHLVLAAGLWLWLHPESVCAAGAPEAASTSAEYQLKVNQYQLTKLGLLGTAIALAFGYFQYWKADRWKRAEFLAREMKDFSADPDVRNVLLMIDWGSRRVNLFHVADQNSDNYPNVTRALQVSALLPHTILFSDGGSDAQAEQVAGTPIGEKNKGFSLEEARIRDSYDRFLDYLERFASYKLSKLISKRELNPYLHYWINDIAAHTDHPDEAAWTCAVMTYIEFYGFTNVQKLFRSYGHDISRSGTLFAEQCKEMQNQELAKQLREARWRE